MLTELIALAFMLPASTYGYGELMCCDIGNPCPCGEGATTASGDKFDPELPTAAVFAPTSLPMTNVTVYMQHNDGPCVAITVNDKGNPRFIGKRGFDLTPGALRALGITPSPTWSGMIKECTNEK